MPPNRQTAPSFSATLPTGRPQAERSVPRLPRLPRAVLARVETLPAGAWSAEHSHPWGQLSYASQGVLQVHTAAGHFIAPPERAVWVPAGLPHTVVNTGPAEMRSLYVASPGLGMPGDCRVLEIGPLLRELILAVCALPELYDEAGAEGRLVQVLLDQLAQARPAVMALPLPTDKRLLRLCAALQAQPADLRTWAGWAQEIGISERSLVRLFQQQTGLAPGAWRRRLRLLLSLSPLAAGDKVAGVALDSGYASASAFITAFSAEFGVTPAQMFAAR